MGKKITTKAPPPKKAKSGPPKPLVTAPRKRQIAGMEAHLIARLDAAAKLRNVTPGYICRLAVADFHVYERLKRGGTMRMSGFQRLGAFLDKIEAAGAAA